MILPHSLLKCCVSALALAAVVAPASGHAATPAGATRASYTFDIPAQDLAGALTRFSRITGLQLSAAPEALRGQRSRAVSGPMTAERALALLVAGAAVEARISAGTVIVRPAVRHGAVDRQQSGRTAAAGLDTAEAGPAPSPLGEDIIVTGFAKAVSLSLDTKRATQVVSDTVTADDMGELPANNVSEALARLPGVNAVRDHTTGEGDRVTVRGLSTELNNYAINGVRLGGAGSRDDNFYRGVRLSVLPPDGIKNITVYKTLTPDRDGDALGGSIDIQTPTAFDYDTTYVRVSAEGGFLDKFDNRKSGELSGAFGQQFNDHIGIFVSGSWSRRRSQFEQNGVDGDNQPMTWYENSETLGWDPNKFVMRGMDLGFGETDVTRWGLNGSIDYRSEDHSLHLRGQYNRYRKEEFLNRLNFRNDTARNSARLVQTDKANAGLAQPDSAVVGYDDTLGRIYSYTVDQIVDADGDGLITDADRTTKSFYSLHGGSGLWDPKGFRLRRFWEGERETGSLASGNLGGVSQFGEVTVDYDVSYSQSQDKLDDGYELEFRSDKYGWLGNTGVLFSSAEDSRFPKWILNDAGMAAVQDPSEYDFSGLSGEIGGSREKLWQGQFNVEWKPDSAWLESIKAGAKYFNSKRRTYSGEFLDLDAGGTLADFANFYGDDIDSLFGGTYSGPYRLGTAIDNDKMLAELQRAEEGKSSVFDGFAVSPNNAVITDEDSFRFNERVIAGYAMATARFGRAQIITGLRVETTRNKVESYIVDEVQGGRYSTDTSRFTNILPSIHTNYDLTENTKLRGAVWTSFARPDIARMSSAQEYGYDSDPDGDGTENPTSDWVLVSIEQGNPDLKPLRAVNVDLSLEHYEGSTGAYSIAAFYKHIENFLYRSSSSNIRNGTAGQNVSPDGVVVSMPNNGKWAEVYGVELSGQQIFHWLPGVLSSLGVGVNLTLQKSKAETGISWHPEGHTLPLVETPERIANIQLFWERKGWEVYAAWTHQSRFMEGIQDFGNNPYEQAYSFVDLTLRKTLFGTSTIALQVQNLFDDHTYWNTVSSGTGASRAYIKNGRTITLSANFIF